MPDNVNLLTLENWSDGSYLIRLEHIYDLDEDDILSKPVTFSIQVILSNEMNQCKITEETVCIFKDLFPGFTITSAEETLLGGNQFKKDSHRLVWNTSGNEGNGQARSKFPDIELKPMEIRTFTLNLVRNNRVDWTQ